MAEIGKYIYGIINSKEEKIFGSLGIPVGELVYSIPYQDISAVVSESEIVDYTRMFKDALARLLLGHQKVVERIMNLGYTIIPFRLGTFCATKEEIEQILARGFPLVKDIFNKINNKIEIDVAAAWGNFDLVIKEAAEEKEIKELKERFLVNPKMITVDEQMRVGVMIKKVLDEKRTKYAQRVQEFLNGLEPICIKTHELMDDKMVINTAFLIDKAKQVDFEEKIEQLNTEFCEKLNFRCVGPLPPYSFYTLEVKKMQFEEIDWARKKLCLSNDTATKDEIKKAHQRLAFSSHPDKNPDTPGIEKEFDEVIRAYKILWEYCQGESCSFDEQDFKKNSVLVKVRE